MAEELRDELHNIVVSARRHKSILDAAFFNYLEWLEFRGGDGTKWNEVNIPSSLLRLEREDNPNG